MLPDRNTRVANKPRRRSRPTSSHGPDRAPLDRPDSGERAARFFLALVTRRIQGGRAAILAPGDRADLLESARRLGLRPFDAALLIAVVQDRVRRGEDPMAPGALPFTPGLTPTRGGHASPLARAWALAITTLALGSAVAAALIALIAA